MAQKEEAQDAKKERQRSPNYPAVSLRDAVERVRKLFTTDGRAGAPPKLAAVHIGFKAAHGQAMSVVAALKRFGLVSEGSGRVAPTHAAIEILNLPESDSRRQAALREAALSPPLYRELVEKHRVSGLPNRDVLEAELITYKKFNPKSVKGFVTDFLDTLEYAKIDVSDAVGDTDVASEQEDEAENMTGQVNIPSGTGHTSSTGALPSLQANAWTWTLSMPRNVKADLRIAGAVTKADIARLKKQIEALEESFDEDEEA